jgi:hypothetical protein
MKKQIANNATISRTACTTPSWGASTLRKLAATALLGLATLSLANAQVPDCVPGKLSDYEKLGAQGCLIGDKKFSNFQYHQGATGMPGDAISLTPGTTPESDDPGLLFEAKWASASEESFVSYDVEVQPDGRPISGASLQMRFGEITGTGRATVLADLCPWDAATDSCASQKLELKVALSANGPKTAADNGQFKEPQRAVRVVTPIDVAPGSGGTADLDGFMAIFRCWNADR